MLHGIDPVLSPELLHLLASMGHGDDLALVDANHPAETIARQTRSGRLIRLPGLAMGRVTQAILSVLPIDDFEPDPLRRMEVVGDPASMPKVQEEVLAEMRAVLRPGTQLAGIERFAFYEAAKKSFGVVQVGDPRPYGCFLMRKGIIAGEPG